MSGYQLMQIHWLGCLTLLFEPSPSVFERSVHDWCIRLHQVCNISWTRRPANICGRGVGLLNGGRICKPARLRLTPYLGKLTDILHS